MEIITIIITVIVSGEVMIITTITIIVHGEIMITEIKIVHWEIMIIITIIIKAFGTIILMKIIIPGEITTINNKSFWDNVNQNENNNSSWANSNNRDRGRVVDLGKMMMKDLEVITMRITKMTLVEIMVEIL